MVKAHSVHFGVLTAPLPFLHPILTITILGNNHRNPLRCL